MAKATKKTSKKNTSGAVSKAAAPKKAVAKKTVVKKAAVKKTAPKKVVRKKGVKKAAPANTTPPSPPPSSRPATTRSVTRGGAAEAATGVVVLEIIFRGVAAGNSEITASFNGEKSTRTSSGKITFSGVQRNDLIGIDGTSPGSTQITISVSAIPEEMNFDKGNFNDTFLIN